MKSNSCWGYILKNNELKELDKDMFIKTLLNQAVNMTNIEKDLRYKKLTALSYDELVKKLNLQKMATGIFGSKVNNDSYMFILLNKTKEELEKFISSKVNIYDYKAEHKKMNDLARKAQEAYYNSGSTIMTDSQYDALYNKIEELENKYNYHPKDSVTQTAGIKETKISKGGKVTHEFPCLSQAKIKHDPDALMKWLGNYDGILSVKEDGNSLVLTYNNGALTTAASRGNGKVGQNITEIIKTQKTIPKYISDKGHVVVRGEFLITFDEFKKINANLQNGEQPYKNPRNLSAGLLHQQDLNIAKSRQGIFNAFELVACTGFDKLKTYEDHLKWCLKEGFNIVKYVKVNKSTIKTEINNFENKIIPGIDHPIDGLVCRYNDNKLVALGYDSHAPKFSVAYKFVDESVPTTLKEIVFQASKTGRINPVAIFDPIELEGTTVQRCTLNNITYIKDKLGKPYIGQEIYIKKNNMIIPGIDEIHTQPNKTVTTNLINLPTKCPACGSPVKLKKDGIAEFLMCENPNCIAKQLKNLELFASKDAMNFDGVSSATIEALVDNGLLKTYSDFYDLPNHKDELFNLEGFGDGTYKNLIKVLDASKTIEAWRFLYALGIPNVGHHASKDICKYFKDDFNSIISATEKDFMNISGIGSTVAKAITTWFKDSNNIAEINKLLSIISFKKTAAAPTNGKSKLNGQSFCVTGALATMKRDKFVELVESNGGVFKSSVGKGLNYLVTNTPDSGSSKNTKAAQLGIKLITEQQFLDMIK